MTDHDPGDENDTTECPRCRRGIRIRAGLYYMRWAAVCWDCCHYTGELWPVIHNVEITGKVTL